MPMGGTIGAGPGELETLAEAAIAGLERAVGRAARTAAALRLHTVLLGVLRGKSAVDLALAETLAAIDATDAVLSLPGSPSSVKSLAREKLGWAPSTTRAQMRTARALHGWPKLREAVRAGEITLRKAQTVLPVVEKVGEDAAIGLAKTLRLRELEERVRALGGEAWQDDVFEQAVLQMDEAQRRRYDRGLEWVQWTGEALGAPRGTRTAYMAMEFLGSHRHASEEERAALEKVDRLAGRATFEAGFWAAAWSTLSDMKDVAPEAVAEVETAWLRAVGRACDVTRAANDEGTLGRDGDGAGRGGGVGPGEGMGPGKGIGPREGMCPGKGIGPCEGMGPGGAVGGAAFGPEADLRGRREVRVPAYASVSAAWSFLRNLDPPEGARVGELYAHALRLHALREAWDLVFGRLAWAMQHERGWALLGAGTWEAYCTGGLGLTPQGVRRHVRLEEKMIELPALRGAMRARRLTFTQALAVARVATPANVEAVIEDALRHAVSDLDDDAEKEADRNLRSRGRVGIFAHVDDLETIRTGIYAMQLHGLRTGVGWISPGEALARLADHFYETWKAHAKEPSRKDRDLVARTNGRCAVPGCTRGAAHRHHLLFRSHGGAGGRENLVLLCAGHHLRAVHRGWLTIRGRAGERLVFTLRSVHPGAAPETWIVEGDLTPVRVADRDAASRAEWGAGTTDTADAVRAGGTTAEEGAGAAGEAAWARAAQALVERAEALRARAA